MGLGGHGEGAFGGGKHGGEGEHVGGGRVGEGHAGGRGGGEYRGIDTTHPARCWGLKFPMTVACKTGGDVPSPPPLYSAAGEEMNLASIFVPLPTKLPCNWHGSKG